MGGQFVVHHHFAAAGFVEDGDFHSIAEAAFGIGDNRSDVVDVDAVRYVVVRDVFTHRTDAAAVAYTDIVQSRVADAGMPPEASWESEFAVETSEADLPAEGGAEDVGSAESFGDFDLPPVFGAASLILQGADLF